jgi:thiamine pyrophosphate-dependent acetolactate synthase large subunit-like protein
MADMRGYEVMAQAFTAEGVDTVFGLMGDANMHWMLAMKSRGARLIHVRHEHSAVGMADGYARKTGKVGVATTTGGPAFTQVATALVIAKQAGTPLIVVAGDTALSAPFHIQQFDQGPFTTSTGAHFIPVRTLDRMLDYVREAFYVARFERRPVVLSVPMDLQRNIFPFPSDYMQSDDVIPVMQRPQPDPERLSQIAALLDEAERPILVAGRGAVRSGAGSAIERLAEASGALLATTLLGKGLFDENPFSIGIAGSFATKLGHELFAEADLVVGIGARLGFYTTEAGYLYPSAKVVQIDTDPKGIWQGLRVADLHLHSDAKAAAEGLYELMERRGPRRTKLRSPTLAQRIGGDSPDPREFPIPDGLVDPRKALVEIDRTVPPDWDIVMGSGHCFNFVATHLRGRPPERYHAVTEFGAIGQTLTTAAGVAAARGDGKVLLIAGDGTLLMQIQELEAIARHGLKMLICSLNDGAYGAEVHMLRAHGDSADEAIFGRGDLGGVARAFGLRGRVVTSLGDFDRMFREHVAGDGAELWDIHIADFPSAAYRRVHYGEE